MSILGVRTVARFAAGSLLVAGAATLTVMQHYPQTQAEKSVSGVQSAGGTQVADTSSDPLTNSNVTVNGKPVSVDKSGNGEVNLPNGSGTTHVQVNGGTTTVVSNGNANSEGDQNGANNQNTQVNISVNGNNSGSTQTFSSGYNYSNGQSSESSNSTQVFSADTNSVSSVTP